MSSSGSAPFQEAPTGTARRSLLAGLGSGLHILQTLVHSPPNAVTVTGGRPCGAADETEHPTGRAAGCGQRPDGPGCGRPRACRPAGRRPDTGRPRPPLRLLGLADLSLRTRRPAAHRYHPAAPPRRDTRDPPAGVRPRTPRQPAGRATRPNRTQRTARRGR